MIIGVHDAENPDTPDGDDVQIPALPEDAVRTLGASQCLRHLIYHQGGTWTAQRALDELSALGWETTAKYPLNLAGNLLNRLSGYGALRQLERGIYAVNRDVLAQILVDGIRVYERARRDADQAPVNQVVPIAPPS